MPQLRIPATQTAVVLKSIGQPLVPSQLPVLEPGDDEALLQIHSAGLIPLDWELRDNGILGIDNRLPAVLGFEGVGTIAKYGTGTASKLPIGTRVIFKGGSSHTTPFVYGALQEYVPTPTQFLVAVPEGYTSEQAASLTINPFTAAVCLFHEAGVAIPLPGSSKAKSYNYSSIKLVVFGAGTNVGKFIVQLACITGFGTIVAVASPSAFKDLKSYGATHVIDRHSQDIVAQVLKIVGDDLQYVIDATPGASAEPDRNLEVFKQAGGSLVQLSVGDAFKDSSKSAAEAKGVSLRRIFADYSIQPQFAAEWIPLFQAWLKEGKIQVPSIQVIPTLDAGKINAALDDVKAAKSGAKYVVKVST
ncbi:hypothetical protein FOQG_15778 [Fusarium oxysporum f. sp. raphani 54005]|uniref:Enoyl reductase (ER) domain-containing protein n=2 Tax=Fusarium oxysporum f. sp. raphani TaxID=96318 RepID=X0CAC8_FUSOX|nr:hypothetical protein FOQG_15778 [Fusarium oxysporum f. sp. raphani 54005]KAG7436969.1 Trans-enoyl reductase lepG [Fusarium oxysporum f. sp. raphani]KAI3572458.1 chaperonin 10-like protein [Fusarium oxysporum f. sp. albedinis]KAJ0129057.1 ABC transporter BEA3 [Fusarium oxysporum f. sp. albedinis]